MASTQRKHKDSSKTRRIWALIITAALVVGSIFVAFPPQDKINQGLDIQGGLSVVLSAKSESDEPVTSEDMEKAKAIIENRVNALGASEASVQIQGNDQILVQIPGMSDSSQALATIGKTGVLEFARLDSFTDEDTKTSIENGSIIDYSTVDTPTGEAPTGALSSLIDYSSAKHITVPSGTYEPLFTGEHITQVTIGRENEASQYYAVNLRLDSEATKAFADASTELLPTNGKIVILLDGEVNSAPAIQSAITTGEVSITGNYTLEDAKSLQTVLDSGSLPVSFEYEQSQTVGPTLGQGELAAGLLSMLIGIIIVMLYMLIFYRGFGIIPAVNMIVFTCVYLGVLGLLSAAGLFSLSLAGIAGIILSIGMTADSVILAIEKFKEELKEGKSLKTAADKGVRHALITSLDADVVSLITAGTLFFIATSSIKGFGLTLALGILCDILVMFVFVSPLIRLLAPHVMRRHPKFWGIEYSELLGDVRTGKRNFMLPEQAYDADEDRKADAIRRKEAERGAAEKRRERDKIADKRAKQMKKDEKAAMKEAKKAKLAEIKELDAKRDAERKAAKKAAKQAAREEKASKKSEHEMEKAEEKIDKLEDEIERESDKFAEALDDQAKADDHFEAFIAKAKEQEAKADEDEEMIESLEDDDVEEAETVEGVVVGGDVEDSADVYAEVDADDTDDDVAADAIDTAADEDERDDIEARSPEAIAEILAATTTGETNYTSKTDKLERVADDSVIENAPSDDMEYGAGAAAKEAFEKAQEQEQAQARMQGQPPQPHKNRAQRRAEARAAKSKKNKTKR